jgi:integrase
MPTIKNKYYNEFINNGFIEFVTPQMYEQAYQNIIGSRNGRQARALLTVLYYTGARPAEALSLKAMDFSKDNKLLSIRIPPLKHGLSHTVMIPLKKPHVTELYEYSRNLMPNVLIFFNFRGHYVRTHKKHNGEIIQYEEISRRLRYHFIKWFNPVIEGSITPYYLRHNRLSSLSAKGASIEELRNFKGAKTTASVMPYLHLSRTAAKKISRLIE